MGIFDRWTRARERTVEAHILDPDGNRVEQWRVGTEVDEDSVKQYGMDGKLYVLVTYENGAARTMLLRHDLWVAARSQFESIDSIGENARRKLGL